MNRNTTHIIVKGDDSDLPGDIIELLGTAQGYLYGGVWHGTSLGPAREAYTLAMKYGQGRAGVEPDKTLHEIMDRMAGNGEAPLSEEEVVAYYDVFWPEILEIRGAYIMEEARNEIAKIDRAELQERITEAALREYLKAFGLMNDLTNDEATQFIKIASAYNLDPFKREVYCVPYGTGDRRRLSIITGYEVYLKRAERIGTLEGWKCWTEGEYQLSIERRTFYKKGGESYPKDVKVAKGNLRAIVEIHKKGWSMPFVHEVFLDEYFKENDMWATMPKSMLKKVAIAQAFRLAFPDEMGGMPYTNDELPDEMTTMRNVTEDEGVGRSGSGNGRNEEAARLAGAVHSHPATQTQDKSAAKTPETRDVIASLTQAKARLIGIMQMKRGADDLFEEDDKANVREKIKSCAGEAADTAADILWALAGVYEKKAAKINADLDERQAEQNQARPVVAESDEAEARTLFDSTAEMDIF